MATFAAFQSGVGPSGCSSLRRISISVLRSLVNSSGSTWILVAKLPMRALSAGSSRLTNSSAPSATRLKLSFMLPLRSSMTTTLRGCVSVAKSVIGWSLPLS